MKKQAFPYEKGLYFIPLGGTREYGINFNLFIIDGQILAVDCGLGFVKDMPGIDIILPDPGFVEDHLDRLVGLVITHAHEDHIGAIGHLWKRLQCPIYAAPFATLLIKNKLSEHGLTKKTPMHPITIGEDIMVGGITVSTINVSHSIPECMMLVIDTPYGKILHTGDWKFDATPMIGADTDWHSLEQLGKENVLAIIGGSTNADIPGFTGSETLVKETFETLFPRHKGRIIVGCFSSNAARIKICFDVAKKTGREVCLMGRSVKTIFKAAQETGYLDKSLTPFPEEDVAALPADKVLIVATGCQGQHRSALDKLSKNGNPNLTLGGDDVIYLSSRIIPGCERDVVNMLNSFEARGVEVVTTQHEKNIHVSGHHHGGDIEKLYSFVHPTMTIPIHGELQHLIARAEIAEKAGCDKICVPDNGSVIRLDGKSAPEIIDEIPINVLAVDGQRVIATDNNIVNGRKAMMHSGAAFVTVVMDQDKISGKELGVNLHGLIATEGTGAKNDQVLLAKLKEIIIESVKDMPIKQRQHDENLIDEVRRAVRRFCKHAFNKKPITTVHIVRI